jgi:spermidine synthase
LSGQASAKIIGAVFITGFTSIITQLVVMREMMSIFYGNELVIGMILAIWMLITGLGAVTGRWLKASVTGTGLIVSLQLTLSLLPIITVFLISYLRNILFPVGVMLGPLQISFFSFLLLFPFCFVSGFMFTSFATFISAQENRNTISRIYLFESLGSVIGSLAFTFIALALLPVFKTLCILCGINLLMVWFISVDFKTLWIKHFIALIFLFVVIASIYVDFDGITAKQLYPGQTITEVIDSRYGKIVVTNTEGQKNIMENGVSIYSDNDVTGCEEGVHYAMLQHSAPASVLLISGGLKGMTDEVLKYPVKAIDYVETDPAITELAIQFNPGLQNPKIHISNTDGRLFIRQTTNSYDVVLVNTPEPSTAMLNRYYSVEFFREAKKKMNKGGVLSISLMSTANYVSDKAGEVNSVLFNSLKKQFKNVLIVPGEKNYFLASDADLSLEIVKMVKAKKLNNIYVSPNYLDDKLIKEQSAYIMKSLNHHSPLNQDFKPVNYYNQIRYWLSYFNLNLYYLLIFVGIVFLMIVMLLDPIRLGLFTTGFSASSIQFLCIFSFQVFYGNVYQLMGLLFGLFMLGLVLGTYMIPKIMRSDRKNFIFLQLLLGAYCLLIPFVFLLLNKYPVGNWIIYLVFAVFTMDIGTLVGGQFAISTQIGNQGIKKTASGNYAADLLGSALGLIIVTGFLFPLLGMFNVFMLIAGFNLVVGGYVFFRR